MWETFILNPMTNILLLLYQYLFSNFALAVAAFTLITRIITLPFTLQSQRSSRAMQELQPELEKLKRKYANDKERLNRVQMELYKKHKINPLGGCLPLLLTFPIMIGLYQTIISSLAASPLQLLELSQRLYAFLPQLTQLIPLNNKWLGINLGQPPGGTQPWYAYLLILLVVATGYLQQKIMSPSPSSASQGDSPAAGMTQSMQVTMPIMYGMITFSLAAGLSIYFIISNVVGILQFWGMGRLGLTRTAPATRAPGLKASEGPPKPEPAKRSRKKRAKR
jgi:YidC/Oxa1 family membrane protein insertase